jgi:hypothetical protein
MLQATLNGVNPTAARDSRYATFTSADNVAAMPMPSINDRGVEIAKIAKIQVPQVEFTPAPIVLPLDSREQSDTTAQIINSEPRNVGTSNDFGFDPSSSSELPEIKDQSLPNQPEEIEKEGGKAGIAKSELSIMDKIKNYSKTTTGKAVMGITALAVIGFAAKKLMSKKTTKKGSDLKGFSLQ